MPRQTVRIVAVGRIGEAYVRGAMAEYEKRLRPFCTLETIELRDEGMKKEGEKFEKYLGPNTYILDVLGKEMDSMQFAKLAGAAQNQAMPLTFIIGSAQGVEEKVKKKAQLLSLSKMTFTHEMCRLFLVEQIYRAFMINANRQYHK